ncbi:hypothetical protein M0R45_015732 [Rubus argutus]|uniref:RRM domain-containing protein n=1 Tax=Rubus argutus TaxID=59490 RepID=A0AAW1XQL6_RUBAR
MGGELEAVTIVLENGHPIWVSQPDPQPNMEPDPLARRKLYVTFDLRDRVHYVELQNYFGRYGPVSGVSLQRVGEGEQPRCAIVTFFSADIVDKILEGARVVTSYIGDKEIRCKPYEPTH